MWISLGKEDCFCFWGGRVGNKIRVEGGVVSNSISGWGGSGEFFYLGVICVEFFVLL